MKKEIFKYGKWFVEYTPEDGARLDRLCYDNYDLVTTAPEKFRAPEADYGEYEKRPVYGYDDCFPSVDQSIFPGTEWNIPDHGEICWLKWETIVKEDRLIFAVRSKEQPFFFKREMQFSKTGINWIFEVKNEGDKTLPFLHVMHPLMKLDEISDFKLPGFQGVYNAITDKMMEELKNADAVKNYLINQKTGTANMLFLQMVDEGKMSWTYKNGLHITVPFPKEYFQSIGIWWNNTGYPNEEGIRRNECAFEPISGLNSVLNDNYKKDLCLSVLPGQTFKWQIPWEINY